MLAIVRPHVRDRWLASQLSFWTPQQVENTCRGAMAGNLLAQWLMFDLMEQSWPRLSKNLNELKNAVIDLEWNLQPYALSGQKPSAEAQRRAEIMEGLCWQMKPEVDADERDFEDTLFDIMDDLGKGIEVSEILWMAPGDPQNTTGLWAPRATKWVHPRYYGYQPYPGADDRLMLNVTEIMLSNPELNRLNGFSGTASAALPNATLDWANAQYARFPKDQFLVSIFKQKSGHPISGALLRILAFGWAASNFAWEWALNLAQIFGLPIRWATYAKDANLQTISAIEDMLSNMGSAGWAAFPEGTKLELFKALESARDNPSKAFIDAWDIICDIVVLGQTLTTSQGERGSQALGTIHKDVRDEKIQAVAKRTAKVLNGQFLPAICRLNFGDDRECPWFQPSSKASKDLTTMATRYKTILSIPGVEVSKQQFYEDNELVVPEADDDVLIGQGPSGSGQGGQDSTGGSGGSGSGQDDGVSETPTTAVAKAKSAATDQLVNNVLEDLTGVEAKWLAGAKPFFRELVAKAKDKSLSDGDFVAALEKAKKEIPELFSKLDGAALAKAFYASMSAAVVNGAVRGFMRRPVGFTVRPHPQERGLNRPGGAR
jgi:phage gp29-like protein